jgi:peptide/nickel transport system permease protein
METVAKSKVTPWWEEEELPPRERLPRWLRALLVNPLSISGAVLVIVFALVALLAPVLAPPADPTNPYNIPRYGYSAQPQPPSAEHIFGTTQGQYDLFYGVIWGTRTAFKIGLLVTLITVIIGALLGALAAFLGGWLDEVFERIVEIFLAFPFLLAALTLATVLGGKFPNSIIPGMIALIVFGWPQYSRLIRGDILSVRERDFVLAARATGVPEFQILLRHILPNAMYSTLVYASLNVGSNVLTFAALSFLGVGAQVGYADWGQLLSFARNWIPSLSSYWWIVVYPGVALLLFSLAWNLIGDALRDAFDPRMRI